MSDSKPAAAGQTGSWHVPAPTDGDRVWSRLAAYVRSGDFLLHGSRTPGLHQLTPRTPIDHSPDTFSKTTAVFATEDPTWAIAYAVRPANTPGFLNACFYPGSTPGREAERRIFLSFALPENGQPPMDAGVVYVLPAQGFSRMPSYLDPQLGVITECQWISTDPVPVSAAIPVHPQNLPLQPRRHDHREAVRRAADEPHGFPWLVRSRAAKRSP